LLPPADKRTKRGQEPFPVVPGFRWVREEEEKTGKERRGEERTGFRGRSVAVSRGASQDVPERPGNPARALRSGTVAGSEADTRLGAPFRNGSEASGSRATQKENLKLCGSPLDTFSRATRFGLTLGG
jgi:hypothetical protein